MQSSGYMFNDNVSSALNFALVQNTECKVKQEKSDRKLYNYNDQ